MSFLKRCKHQMVSTLIFLFQKINNLGLEISQFKQRTFFDEDIQPNIWNELLKFTQSKTSQGMFDVFIL